MAGFNSHTNCARVEIKAKAMTPVLVRKTASFLMSFRGGKGTFSNTIISGKEEKM